MSLYFARLNKWTNQKGNSYTASPVLHDGILYFVTDRGMVSAFDAKTGEKFYHQQRLPNAYSFMVTKDLAEAVGRAAQAALVVVGTYADTLAKLTFELNHCILLAFVAAHGWMADEMVERFLQTVRGTDLTAVTSRTRNP